MKVIDLLNKIANKEVVPANIRIRGQEFYICDKHTTNNDYDFQNNDGTYLMEYLGEFAYITDYLNCEVITGDKKIEKITKCDLAISINDIYNDNVDVLMNKINELIDEVNKLKEEK